VEISPDYVHLSSLQASAAPDVRPDTAHAPTVQNAINAINESELLGFDRELRFSSDPRSRFGVVEVLDRSTGDVIVQLPSQFILNLAQNLQKGN
jgi:uncharacterized FlaG/YvyC family protein